MSHYSSFTTPFGGEDRNFALPWDRAVEFEAAHGSAAVQLRSLATGEWTLPPVRDLIRLGLIGGGMLAGDAHRLVRDYVEGQPLTETAPIAVQILDRFLNGPEDADVGD